MYPDKPAGEARRAMAHGHGQEYSPEYACYCSPVTNVSLSGIRPEQVAFPAHVPNIFLTECPDLAFGESGPRSRREYGQDMSLICFLCRSNP